MTIADLGVQPVQPCAAVKNGGIMVTVRVSSKGQIASPKAIREQVGLKEGAELAISVRGRDVIPRKVVDGSWRRWRGVLKSTYALQEHEREPREEIERDAKDS